MIPAKAWNDDFAAELVFGLQNLMPGGGHVGTIIAPYVPSADLVLSDLTIGGGSLAPKNAGVIDSGLDPTTGRQRLIVKPPGTGYTWIYSGISPAPPITIYGFSLVAIGSPDVLLAVTERLANPILLTQRSLVVLGQFSGLISFPILE